jgi:hypothetical protein
MDGIDLFSLALPLILALVAAGCLAVDTMSNGYERDGTIHGDMPGIRFASRVVLGGASCACYLIYPSAVYGVIACGGIMIGLVMTYCNKGHSQGGCELRCIASIGVATVTTFAFLAVTLHEVAQGMLCAWR